LRRRGKGPGQATPPIGFDVHHSVLNCLLAAALLTALHPGDEAVLDPTAELAFRVPLEEIIEEFGFSF
jgi:hypothetical protein